MSFEIVCTYPGWQSCAPAHLCRDVHPGQVLDQPRDGLHDLEHLASQLRRADLAAAVRHHRDLLGLRQRGRDLSSDLQEREGIDSGVRTSYGRSVGRAIGQFSAIFRQSSAVEKCVQFPRKVDPWVTAFRHKWWWLRWVRS